MTFSINLIHLSLEYCRSLWTRPWVVEEGLNFHENRIKAGIVVDVILFFPFSFRLFCLPRIIFTQCSHNTT